MMAIQSEREDRREPRYNADRAVRYDLKVELRRLERHGRGNSPYAEAIRDVIWLLANEGDENLIGLLEREMARAEPNDADEPYAKAIQMVLDRLEESDRTAQELFAYYLQQLERQGRGNEPFACAIREALDSEDACMLSALLHLRDDGTREPGAVEDASG